MTPLGKRLRASRLSRVKGFPVMLQKEHWWYVLMAYDYARQHGLNTKEMDEAAALVPDVRPSDMEIQHAIATDERWSYYPRGRKTVRFRAAQVNGAIQLLRLAKFFNPHGALSSTIARRIDKLREIGALDLLADTGR